MKVAIRALISQNIKKICTLYSGVHPLFLQLAKMLACDILKCIEEKKSSINIEEFAELDLACKMTLKRCLEDEYQDEPLIKVQAVLDYTYERINIGNWKEIKPYLRKTMTVASFLKLILYFKHKPSNEFITESGLQECFKIIDYGLLFGCPLESDACLLQNCAAILNEINSKLFPPKLSPARPIEDKGSTNQVNTKQVIDLEYITCPSMEYFFKNYIEKEKPVILKDCIRHWPALHKWNDLNYLLTVAGKRTVPIEIGSKYTDTEWTQKLMTLEEFMRNHIYEAKGSTGYLAQYQLFEQIPELKQDIVEPEYCCFSDCEEPTDINAWYGPKGTISPLHHDPKRNLLAQVIGEKRIFLFSPSDSEYLYPHDNELLNNTAKVDPREPNYDLYPKYKEARGFHSVLTPGDMLYIPPKWWHFVESLSISFSVSFWWR